MSAVRLQKVLAGAGVASRRAAELLITAGRVRVEGRVVTTLGTRVAEDARVEVDGREVQVHAPIVLVMNKPDAVVSSEERAVDARGRPTVVSLLRGLPTPVVPVGRLDYHTRGVLLLTNDGKLASALTSARRPVSKTYHAKFQGRLPEAILEQLHGGVVLDDGTRTLPALEVEIVKATVQNTWVQITIAQNIYRQVRRMGDAVGHSVLKLIRVAFAGITATGLREGEWRILRDDEVAHLRTVVSGKATGPAPAPPERVRTAAPARPPARGRTRRAATAPNSGPKGRADNSGPHGRKDKRGAVRSKRGSRAGRG